MSNITQDAEPIADQPPQPDLQSRISMRRAELIKTLTELKTDTRLGAGELRDKLKARLSELAHVVKWGIVDGWAAIGEPVTQKLQVWLTESAHQVLPTRATTAAPVNSPVPASTPVPANTPVANPPLPSTMPAPAKAGPS